MSSTSVRDLLGELEANVRDDDFEAATSTLESIVSNYDEREGRESILFNRASTLQTSNSIPSEDRAALGEFQSTLTQTDMARGSVLVLGSLFLTDPEAVDKSQFIGRISDLASSEQRLAERSDEVEALVSEPELPARIVISTVESDKEELKVGESVPVEVAVVNVGDSPANSVNIRAASDLTVSPEQREIAELTASEERTVEFNLEGSTSGDFTLTITASTDNAGSASQSRTFTVLRREGLYESVVARLESLSDRLTSSDEVSDSDAADLNSMLNSAIDNVQQAITRLEEDNPTRANEAIRTANVQLGEFLDSFEELSEPSAAFSRSVTNSAELAIEQLSDTLDVLRINEAIDRNDNGLIDDDEILRAIELWRSDESVPGTGGKTIGGTKILELIDAWRNETEIR
jgi:hypothetical protein